MSRVASTRVCAVALVAVTAGMLLGDVSPASAEQDWDNLSPRERYDAMQNYWKHERLPKDRQRDVERRYERWQRMSPEEQQRIRKNYERFQQLPPSERRRVERELEEKKRPREKKDRPKR